MLRKGYPLKTVGWYQANWLSHVHEHVVDHAPHSKTSDIFRTQSRLNVFLRAYYFLWPLPCWDCLENSLRNISPKQAHKQGDRFFTPHVKIREIDHGVPITYFPSWPAPFQNGSLIGYFCFNDTVSVPDCTEPITTQHLMRPKLPASFGRNSPVTFRQSGCF